MARPRSLLREYVRQVLNEDDYGLGGGYAGLDLGDPTGGSGMGMSFASGDQLYNVFVKPFADVVGVAAGKTKEVSQKAQTLLKVAFEAVATTLLPVLGDSYKEIFAKEKEEIGKIQSEYAQVYQATWEAFKENDVLAAAFAYRPDLFLNVQLARKAPKAVAKLLSILSGGALDKALHKLLSAASGKKSPSEFFASEGPGMPLESALHEEETGQASPLEKLVADKRVKQALAQSQVVQSMSREGQQAVRGTLNQVFKQASAVLAAKTLADLQKATGKPLKGLDKLQQVPQQERQKAELALLASVKKSMKAFYQRNIEERIKAAIDSGVPKNHPYVADFQHALSKIKAL